MFILKQIGKNVRCELCFQTVFSVVDTNVSYKSDVNISSRSLARSNYYSFFSTGAIVSRLFTLSGQEFFLLQLTLDMESLSGFFSPE